MLNTGPNPIRVLVFDASLRVGSLNDRLASLAASVVEQFAGAVDRARMADFDCPSYDTDVEKSDGIPPGAEQLRKRLEAADAFLIASPEYNASMPGGLKNVIDWVSRTKPQPFNGKQGLLMSASPSMAGGNRGLWTLRIPLEHLGARVYPDMFSLAQAHQAFDGSGTHRQLHAPGTIRAHYRMLHGSRRSRGTLSGAQEAMGRIPRRTARRVYRPGGVYNDRWRLTKFPGGGP